MPALGLYKKRPVNSQTPMEEGFGDGVGGSTPHCSTILLIVSGSGKSWYFLVCLPDSNVLSNPMVTQVGG